MTSLPKDQLDRIYRQLDKLTERIKTLDVTHRLTGKKKLLKERKHLIDLRFRVKTHLEAQQKQQL